MVALFGIEWLLVEDVLIYALLVCISTFYVWGSDGQLEKIRLLVVSLLLIFIKFFIEFYTNFNFFNAYSDFYANTNPIVITILFVAIPILTYKIGLMNRSQYTT